MILFHTYICYVIGDYFIYNINYCRILKYKLQYWRYFVCVSNHPSVIISSQFSGHYNVR